MTRHSNPLPPLSPASTAYGHLDRHRAHTRHGNHPLAQRPHTSHKPCSETHQITTRLQHKHPPAWSRCTASASAPHTATWWHVRMTSASSSGSTSSAWGSQRRQHQTRHGTAPSARSSGRALVPAERVGVRVGGHRWGTLYCMVLHGKVSGRVLNTGDGMCQHWNGMQAFLTVRLFDSNPNLKTLSLWVLLWVIILFACVFLCCGAFAMQ